MSKKAKDTAPKSENGGLVAVAEKKTGNVEELPKGMSRTKDGLIALKAGNYRALVRAEYELHQGARMTLEGNVFVADYNVNWLPAKSCVCKTERTSPVTIKRLKSKHFAVTATCANKKCDYGDVTYLWVQPADRFQY